MQVVAREQVCGADRARPVAYSFGRDNHAIAHQRQAAISARTNAQALSLRNGSFSAKMNNHQDERSCIMEAIKEHRTIAKVYRKVQLLDQATDFAFWQSRPPAARLAALEEIRCEYHGWRHDTQPRLQRVYTIVKR